MKKLIIIPVVLCYCKQYEQNPKSLAGPDDEVKIAINYIGDDNCKNDDARDKSSTMNDHKLNGPDGELVVEEYKDVKKNDELVLSGDNFLSSNGIVRSIDAIETHCRRLILSIDADSLPTIKVISGSIPTNQRARFEKDFSEFKTFACQNKFCTSNEINKTKSSKRYFVYIETDDKGTFSAKLTYAHSGTTKSDTSITLKDVKPRTVDSEIVSSCFAPLGITASRTQDSSVSGDYQVGLNCKQVLSINPNSKDYLKTNNVRCERGEKGITILIGNSERIDSDCAKDSFITLALDGNNLKITSDGKDELTTIIFDSSGNFVNSSP